MTVQQTAPAVNARSTRAQECRWCRHEHVVSVSVCPPGVRTILVTAWVDRGGNLNVVRQPVLAVEAIVLDVWLKPFPAAADPPPAPAAPWARRAWQAAGWRYRRETEVRYVTADHRADAGGLTDDLYSEEAMTELVAAEWPPAEDESRLRAVVRKLTALAGPPTTAGRARG